MAKLIGIDEGLNISAGVGSTLTFSGAKISDLGKHGASEYTLACILVDISGSVSSFKSSLEKALVTIVDTLKSSARAENILLRVATFNNTVNEIHGFKPLADIDLKDYQLNCGGATALNNATFSGIGSVITYGESLYDQDFEVNGIVFVVTDGEDCVRGHTPADIKNMIDTLPSKEKIESLRTILVGINTSNHSIKTALQNFKDAAGFDQYEAVDNATPASLAKLAAFTSKSISSQSASLGTGGPSQALSFT